MTPIQLPVRRPLLPVTAAMVILDLNEDKVMQLVENGRLPWVFDIRGKHSGRATLRICAQSVSNLLLKTTTLDKNAPFSTVVDYLFPYHTETVQAVRLVRVFSCCSEHIRNLIAQGSLRLATAGKRGPDNTTEVYFNSVIEFLKSRRFL